MKDLRETFLRIAFRTKKDTDKSSRTYWNTRWLLNIQHDKLTPQTQKIVITTVRKLLRKHQCANVLEVGCGAHVPLRPLGNATHMDYSMTALRKSKLPSFIYADLVKRIPVPDKTFDATFSSCCLMHIPDDELPYACAEIQRVTKKLVILNEPGDRDIAAYFDGLACEQPFRGSS